MQAVAAIRTPPTRRSFSSIWSSREARIRGRWIRRRRAAGASPSPWSESAWATAARECRRAAHCARQINSKSLSTAAAVNCIQPSRYSYRHTQPSRRSTDRERICSQSAGGLPAASRPSAAACPPPASASGAPVQWRKYPIEPSSNSRRLSSGRPASTCAAYQQLDHSSPAEIRHARSATCVPPAG